MLSRSNLLLFNFHFNFHILRGVRYIITELPGSTGTTCDYHNLYENYLDNNFPFNFTQEAFPRIARKTGFRKRDAEPGFAACEGSLRRRVLYEEKSLASPNATMLGTRRVEKNNLTYRYNA